MPLPVVTFAETGQREYRELVSQPLFDTECVAAGILTTQKQFFANVIGSSDASGIINQKTLGETSLNTQHQLPNGYRFDISHWNIKFSMNNPYDGTIVFSDVQALFIGAWFTFEISGIVVAQCPLDDVPSGAQLEYDNGGSTSTFNARLGSAHRSNALMAKARNQGPQIDSN